MQLYSVLFEIKHFSWRMWRILTKIDPCILHSVTDAHNMVGVAAINLIIIIKSKPLIS